MKREVQRYGEADEKEEVIRFGSYNNHNRRNGGMESALCGMDQANTCLGVFEETKIAGVIFVQ